MSVPRNQESGVLVLVRLLNLSLNSFEHGLVIRLSYILPSARGGEALLRSHAGDQAGEITCPIIDLSESVVLVFSR